MSKMKITGYSILDIAKHMYGAEAVITTTFLRHNRGKTFDQLWQEDRLYVRTDLVCMANNCGGKPSTKPEVIKARLIAYAQKHGLPLVEMEG
ncbi:MAG: hypothetical protein HC882_01870 [Acidobacteria bacterium]|nr:hypothetical protein [Acidobacteriota bacterium]